MIKTQFKDLLEFDTYLIEQKSRMSKGYLTRSERETLKKMLEKDYKPYIVKEERKKLPLVTNIAELSKQCQEVTKEDNIKEIVQKLKDTLACYNGIGLSANQIGIQKKISYIKIPSFENKEFKLKEYVLINAKIIEKDRPIQVKGESCLSFQGVQVITKRFVFITVEYLDENLKSQVMAVQDLESLAIQHEVDHQLGITLFDRKW